MKIWVNPVGFNQAKQLLKNNKDDFIVVGIKQLSTRNSCLVSFAQIKQLLTLNKDLVVSLNNLYVDDQLELLTNCLKQLKQLKVKNIIFADYAIKQICDELNYHPYLVYEGITLNTNYGQLAFFKENKIPEVVLSSQLFLNEIIEIAKHKQGVKVMLKAEGYDLLMHSKWMLLTNFQKEFKVKKNLSNQLFYLKEETRQLPNLIYEDETGTHMFSGYNVSILDYLDQFTKVDSLYIFSYLHDAKWVEQTLDIYHQALKDIKAKKFSKTKKALIAKLNKINKISTCGFIDPTKGLLHLQKGANNE